MTDADYMLRILQEHEGAYVAQTEILERSYEDRGHGLTVHSRAADLRARGLDIECDVKVTPAGRRQSFYRLGPSVVAASGKPPTGTDSPEGRTPANAVREDGVEPPHGSTRLPAGGSDTGAVHPPGGPVPLPLFDMQEKPAWA